MINHKHKFIFVHIPRTGGTSIEFIFGAKEEELAHRKHYTPENYICDYGRSIWDNYFKFVFVRNPWERIISWLFFKKQCDKNLENIQCIEDIINLGNSAHIFGPQCLWVKGFDFNFIGRYENLETDFEKICQMLNINIKLPWVNKTEKDHYSKYYTPTTQGIIAQKEKFIVENFNYEF